MICRQTNRNIDRAERHERKSAARDGISITQIRKIEIAILVLVSLFLSVGNVHSQPYPSGMPGYSVDTSYSRPIYLGGSMVLTVNVTNRAYYVVASVERIEILMDWRTVFTGSTPRSLEPGESSTWQFSPVDIPSSTWRGQHVCLLTVTLSFLYPIWPEGRDVTYVPIETTSNIPIQFVVQPWPSSGPLETVSEPSFVKAVEYTPSLTSRPSSLASSLYRNVMIALVAIAVLFLVARPHWPHGCLRNRAHNKIADRYGV